MLVAFVIDVNSSMGARKSRREGVEAASLAGTSNNDTSSLNGSSAPCNKSPSSSASSSASVASHVRGSGLSTLEWAKSSIEHFLKARQKANFRDQYFLLTTEKGTGAILSSWGDPLTRFDEQLRTLAPLPPNKPTDVGRAISLAFSLMNQYRLQRPLLDNYGQGRCPWRIEPGCCLLLTDGESLRGGGGGDDGIDRQEQQQQQQHLHLACPYQELTRDPYRWDQRFFPIIMHQQASYSSNGGASPSSSFPPINVLKALADSTGGYYSMSDCLTGVNAKVDLILHKLSHIGPVAILIPDLTDQPIGSGGVNTLNPSASSSSQQHSVPVRAILSLDQDSNSCIWPIPEEYWLDRSLEHLPRRDAQPTLLYRRLAPDSGDPTLLSIAVFEQLGLAMDRYPLEWCGQSLKMSRDAKWPVYLLDSSRIKGSKGEPFGYIEASELAGRATLVLLPYNYPRFAELVKQALDKGSLCSNLTNLPVKWRPDFNQYLSQTPPYYYPSLKICLKKVGLHSQVPENKTGGLSQIVMKRLQRLRETAAEENQKVESSRKDHPNRKEDGHISSPIGLQGSSLGSAAAAVSYSSSSFLDSQQQDDILLRLSNENELLPMWEGMRHRLFGEHGHTIRGLYVKGFKSWRGTCRGDRARRDDLTLLRDVGGHQVPENPIVEMGSYAETLEKLETMRDPTAEPDPDDDSPEAARQKRLAVNFGNPFRQEKLGRQQSVVYEYSLIEGTRAPAAASAAEAERENEAAVLGPHSVLGDDLISDVGGFIEEGDGDEGAVNMKKVEAGEGGGEDDGAVNEGQPARKRQRVNELPSLPFAKKIRRSHRSDSLSSLLSSSSSSSGTPPQGVTAVPTTPMVVASVHSLSSTSYLDGGVDEEEQQAASSLSLLQQQRHPQQHHHDEPLQQPSSSSPIMTPPSSPSVVKPTIDDHHQQDSRPLAIPSFSPSSQQGEEKSSSKRQSSRKAKVVLSDSSDGTVVSQQKNQQQQQGAAAQKQTHHQKTAIPVVEGSKSTSSATTLSSSAAAAANSQSLPIRPIEELLKDPSLKTPNQDGWILAFSKREQRPYYFNTKTNKSVWSAPPGLPPINVEVAAVVATGGANEGTATENAEGRVGTNTIK